MADLTDILTFSQVLEHMGTKVIRDDSTLSLDAMHIKELEAPYEMMPKHSKEP